MATQSAQAKIYTTFKSDVVALRILSSDIFERTGGSPTMVFTQTANVTKIVRFTPDLTAVTSSSATGRYSTTYTGSLAANKKIAMSSKAILDLRQPTRITIDLSKVVFPVTSGATYSIQLTEGFFVEKFNNQMPTPAITLASITANNRPLLSGYNPYNGQTNYLDNTTITLQANVENVSGTLIRGTGFFRLYRNGTLATSISVLDSSKVTITGNKISIKLTGFLDAGKSYYLLIDNGVVIDRDGFVSQAVSSNSAIAFSTAASTNVDFPDLTSLEMAAAVLTLPQSEIMIYFGGALTSTFTQSATLQKLQVGAGTSSATATMVVNANANKPFASLEVTAFSLSAQLKGVRDYYSTMNSSTAMNTNGGKLKEATANMTAFAVEFDMMGKLLNPNSIPMSAIFTTATNGMRLRRMTKNLAAVATQTATAYKVVQAVANIASVSSFTVTPNIATPNTLIEKTNSNFVVYNRSYTDPNRWIKTETVTQSNTYMDVNPYMTELALTSSSTAPADIFVYQRAGGDQRWNLFSTNSILTGYGVGSANGIRYNHNGTKMAVAHSYAGNINRNVSVFSWGGSSWTQHSSGLSAGSPYNALAMDVAWNHNGTKLAVIQTVANRLRIYNYNGTTFTLAYEGGPGVFPNRVKFSPDGTQIAVGTMTTFGGLTDDPIWMARVSDMTRVTIVEPGELGQVKDLEWDPTGTYIAAVTDLSPYVYIYKNNSGTYNRTANPDVIPTTTAYGVSWNSDGTMLYVTVNASPYVLIYQRTGDTFTRVIPTSPTFVNGTFIEYKGT